MNIADIHRRLRERLGNIVSPELEYSAHVRDTPPPMLAFASSFQPRFTA